MSGLLLFPVLLLGGYLYQDSSANTVPPLEVLSFKWDRIRESLPAAETTPTPVPTTQSIARDAQRKDPPPAGQRPQDPNLDTVETRSAALDHVGRVSAPVRRVEGVVYRVKMRNTKSLVISGVIWEYQFRETANPANVTRRLFACPVKVKSNKQIDFRVFSTLGPANVISVESLSNKGASLFQEAVIIDYVRFADGSVWQRSDWDSVEASRASEALKVSGSAQCFVR